MELDTLRSAAVGRLSKIAMGDSLAMTKVLLFFICPLVAEKLHESAEQWRESVTPHTVEEAKLAQGESTHD